MNKYLNVFWKPLVALLGFPILLALILEIAIHGTGFSILPNVIENILFALLIFIVVNEMTRIKYGNHLSNLLIGFFYLVIILETGLFLLFQTRFNASYIYVILNTNFDEVREFSSVYYQYNLLWLMLFLIPISRLFIKKIFKKSKTKFSGLIISAILCVAILSILKFSALIVYNLPYLTIKSYNQYQEQVESIISFNTKLNPIETSNVTNNDAVVVVIGESATRNHLGIYGYKRETTPRIEKMADSILAYNNVISSHVFTTASLFDVLTLKNRENQNESTPLISILKNAGYKVYWISNHRPVGFHDNLVSRLASAADESKFLSYNDYRNKTSYDEVLLPLLEEKLSVSGKKVIFVHILGNHYAYDKRYPKEFDKFSSNNSGKREHIINTYDNAILYTDFIVSEMIKIVKESDLKSALIYFSDHGEEVFDNADFFGHFENKPTSAMYEVPFLLYMSPEFERPLDFEIDENRAFMLDDFPHSFGHFIGIESEWVKQEKSLFSSHFLPRKRIIQDSLDFDVFKRNENN